MKSRTAEAALLGVTLIWGTSFTIVKSALMDASPLLFLGVRFSLAAIVLFAIYQNELFSISRSGFRGGFWAGWWLFLSMALQTVGLRYTTPSQSAFLTALNVVLVPLLGSIVYRSVPRFVEGIAAGMAIAGTAFMTWPSGSHTWNRGDLLTVGCAVAFAAHILTMGYWAPRTSAIPLSLVQTAVAAVISLAAAPVLENLYWRPSARLFGALAVTSLLCTALAYTVQAWAQQYTSATRAALIFSAEPVSASATAWLVTGETLTPAAWMGAALILAAVLVVESKPSAAVLHP